MLFDGIKSLVRRYRQGLMYIGQFSRDGIGYKTRLQFLVNYWSLCFIVKFNSDLPCGKALIVLKPKQESTNRITQIDQSSLSFTAPNDTS